MLMAMLFIRFLMLLSHCAKFSSKYLFIYILFQGLYPESHGIVANYFMNKARNDTFAYWIPASKEGKWWKGEPVRT